MSSFAQNYANAKNGIASPVWFRVEAPVTRRSPHRSGREAFPHTVPRFKLFLPSCQPIRRSG